MKEVKVFTRNSSGLWEILSVLLVLALLSVILGVPLIPLNEHVLFLKFTCFFGILIMCILAFTRESNKYKELELPLNTSMEVLHIDISDEYREKYPLMLIKYNDRKTDTSTERLLVEVRQYYFVDGRLPEVGVPFSLLDKGGLYYVLEEDDLLTGDKVMGTTDSQAA